MPFWWQRRKRWYYRGRRRPYYKRTYKTKRRRRFNRRKYKRPYRRRRKRRGKVRRKKKTITLKQWQPETIRKCKIKGHICHVLGGEGRQFACYTDTQYDWNLPTTPGGGGFGVEKFTLQFLYNENKRNHNIWTTSNSMLDLVRYTGTTFRFYRHSHLDFIVHYQRNYPMQLEKYTYAFTHPATLLLLKHKKIVPSFLTAPLKKKRYVTVKIRPPTQMINKWFFQSGFSDTGLFTLHTTVCDLRYQRLGCCNSNRLVSFYILNPQFYQWGDWGNKSSDTNPYKPYSQAQSGTYTGTDYKGATISVSIDTSTYDKSISYGSGWFTSKLLQIADLTSPSEVDPVKASRYNPTIDTGIGNKVWVTSILKRDIGPPTTDTQLILEELPLWQLLFGALNYINKIKQDKYFLKTYFLVFQTKFAEPAAGTPNYFMPIDKTFIMGQNPYGRFSKHDPNSHWFPNVSNQLETINAIVQSGPYMPKLDNIKQSTWELDSSYTVYLKFGGATLPDAYAADPSKQANYEVPDMFNKAVQICNPSKQDPRSILHAWDFRRGFATKSALKRMRDHQETDTSFQYSTDTEASPQKKKKTTNSLPLKEKDQEEEEACLLSLFEEDTCQESQASQDLYQLIQQQKQQQQQIKFNLLNLISKLKAKQKIIQLQTGLLD
nr:MAG: ORF1 [Torque teno midi virus]UHM25979.1 MAG: ORF1 [Torque teno midi virus]